MKLTATQRQMVEGGFPACLIVTPAETARRARYWETHPPKAMPLFQLNKTRDESADTVAFRAQEEERRRLKSLAGISRMKTRMASKAIDYTKVRWDARRAKFVPLTGQVPAAPAAPMQIMEAEMAQACERHDWSRVNKDTARRLAELNGVWDDKYEKLSGGLLVMTATNRLKGLVKKGGEIQWQ